LIAAFDAGDEAASTEVYDRYGDRVYSYALNFTRSDDIAAEATLQTFGQAAEELDDLDEPEHFRSWLFSLAHRHVKDLGGGMPAVSDTDDEDGLRREILDATGDLGARDRHLMLLHLAEGLEGEELARASGIEEENLDELVSRMRRRVEGALGALLIARLGNPECDEIEDVFGDWDGEYDAQLRARINRHIGGCGRCQERRSLLLSPLAALPGIMLVSPPPELRGRVRVSAASARRAEPEDETVGEEQIEIADEGGSPPAPVAATPPPQADPVMDPARAAVPPARDDGSRDLAKLALFLAVTIVVGLIGLSVAGRFDPLQVPEGELEGPVVSSTTTTAPEATTTVASNDEPATTTTTASPPEVGVGTTSIDFGDDGTSAAFEVTNSGGSVGEITLSASSGAIALSASEASLAAGETATFEASLDRNAVEEGDIGETITVSWAGGDIEISAIGTHEDNPIIHNPRVSPAEVQVDGGSACPATRTTVSARVRDTSPLESVVARWNDGSSTRETAMDGVGEDVYEGAIGPFSSPQTAEVRIVAFDERGNAGGAVVSVNVVPCP
jgi:DNA-directed RNA polymerase specialized sigma24 family protein